jgi:hypothetical protein
MLLISDFCGRGSDACVVQEGSIEGFFYFQVVSSKSLDVNSENG